LFDLTVELLIHGTTDGREAQVGVEVQVIVPVDTVTTGGEELGELVGHGPISPEKARDLTSRATTLRRIDVDRLTGRVVGVGDAIAVPPMPSTRPSPRCSPTLFLSGT
jgi:hypothetical protein